MRCFYNDYKPDQGECTCVHQGSKDLQCFYNDYKPDQGGCMCVHRGSTDLIVMCAAYTQTETRMDGGGAAKEEYDVNL